MTHYFDTACPTCNAPPRQRCNALAGFGGAHATRISAAKKNQE